MNRASSGSSRLSKVWSNLADNLFGFDRSETTGERLHIRVVEATVAAFAAYLCWTWGLYIQRNISEPHLELGIAQYIDVSFMFDHYVAVGNAIVIAALLAVGFLRLWRPAYFIALLLFHLQYVTKNILGEISHGSNLVGMAVLGFGLAHLYFSDEQVRRRFAIGFLYFYIGVGYTTAAFCKFVGTGLTWAHGHHLWMWIAERKTDVISKFGAFDPNLLQELVLSDVTWATLVLTFAHFSELVAVGVWWRRFRYPVMLMIVGLHIGIAFTMNIFFTWTTILLALVALPWGSVYDWAWSPAEVSLRRGQEARAHS